MLIHSVFAVPVAIVLMSVRKIGPTNGSKTEVSANDSLFHVFLPRSVARKLKPDDELTMVVVLDKKMQHAGEVLYLATMAHYRACVLIGKGTIWEEYCRIEMEKTGQEHRVRSLKKILVAHAALGTQSSGPGGCGT